MATVTDSDGTDERYDSSEHARTAGVDEPMAGDGDREWDDITSPPHEHKEQEDDLSVESYVVCSLEEEGKSHALARRWAERKARNVGVKIIL